MALVEKVVQKKPNEAPRVRVKKMQLVPLMFIPFAFPATLLFAERARYQVDGHMKRKWKLFFFPLIVFLLSEGVSGSTVGDREGRDRRRRSPLGPDAYKADYYGNYHQNENNHPLATYSLPEKAEDVVINLESGDMPVNEVLLWEDANRTAMGFPVGSSFWWGYWIGFVMWCLTLTWVFWCYHHFDETPETPPLRVSDLRDLPVGFGRHATFTHEDRYQQQPGYTAWARTQAHTTNQMRTRLQYADLRDSGVAPGPEWWWERLNWAHIVRTVQQLCVISAIISASGYTLNLFTFDIGHRGAGGATTRVPDSDHTDRLSIGLCGFATSVWAGLEMRAAFEFQDIDLAVAMMNLVTLIFLAAVQFIPLHREPKWEWAANTRVHGGAETLGTAIIWPAGIAVDQNRDTRTTSCS